MRVITRVATLRVVASLILFWCCDITNAQVGSLSGPLWGLVFDDDVGSLRPLRGIPGSATLGDPFPLPVSLSRALIVDTRHAIVQPRNSEHVLVLDMSADPPSTIPIPGVPAQYSLAALSADNTTAAFYHRDQHAIWIVKGLPRAPVLQFVDWIVAGSISNLAVSNDGNVWIYSTTTSEGDELYSRTTSSSSARFITAAGSISGLLIVGRNAVVADRQTSEVFAVFELEGGTVRHHLAGEQNGIRNPAGVATLSGDSIYVANASGDVTILDLSGRALRAYQCACSVSTFSRLGDAAFQISNSESGALFVFSADGFDERISFVPKNEAAQ